jgi:hypothetical protein
MSKASAFMLHLNSTITFHEDGSLPQDIRGQTFKVTRVDMLLLNDVYFNQELFPSYELTGYLGNKIILSPFQFEEDNDELKLRVTKCILAEDLKALFHPHNFKELLNLKQDENNYFSIEENNVSAQLKHWISRTYYLDIKDLEVATSTYIEYDARNKKNLNYTLLLKKYPFHKYFLFSGDYNSFYLEVNFENEPQVKATTFLSFSDIDSITHQDQPEKIYSHTE